MSVRSRIQCVHCCEVINLTESEKDIYKGSGVKFARFKDCVLVELIDPLQTPDEHLESVQQITRASVAYCVALLNSPGVELWLVMCSCYQLCDPRRIMPDDPAGIATISHVIREQMRSAACSRRGG